MAMRRYVDRPSVWACTSASVIASGVSENTRPLNVATSSSATPGRNIAPAAMLRTLSPTTTDASSRSLAPLLLLLPAVSSLGASSNVPAMEDVPVASAAVTESAWADADDDDDDGDGLAASGSMLRLSEIPTPVDSDDDDDEAEKR